MKHKARSYLIWIALSIEIVIVFVAGRQLNVQAQASENDCNGLDIVFLVDQSGSMRDNDPDVLRMAAVKTAIDIIGDNATYFCPEAQHRISVLGFGDSDGSELDVLPYIGSELVSPDLVNLSQWQADKNLFKDSLPSDNRSETLLGNTNIEAAYNAAHQKLQVWQNAPMDEMERKQAVVLLTDGGPCVIEDGVIVSGCTSFGRAMDVLEALTDPNRLNFPWRGADNPNSVYLWVIALQNADQGKCYLCDEALLESWQTITRGHGGDIFQLQYGENVILNADMTSVVATVMDSMLGSQLDTWDCQEPIWIDPYVSNVSIIHLFRRNANPGYDLEDVIIRIRAERDGQTVAEFQGGVVIQGQGSVDDYSQDGPNERYVFYMPPAGMYIVEAENADICQDLDVRIGQNGIRLNTLSPSQGAIFTQVDQEPYYSAEDPIPFNIQLLQIGPDGGLLPLQEDPEFPISISVTVRSQDDVAVDVEDTYRLARIDDDAHYSSVNPDTLTPTYLKFQYPGHYTWELIATAENPRATYTPNPDSTPIIVATARGEFQVAPLIRFFDFAVHAPTQVRLVDGTSDRPVQVTLDVVDQDGIPLRRDLMIAGTGSYPFEVFLYDQGNNLIDRQYMSLVESSNSSYVVDLYGSGADRLHFEEGEYTVVVNLTSDYNRDLYTPLRQTSQVGPVKMALAQRFAWSVSEPVSGTVTSVHPAFGWFPEPHKVTMVLRTTTTSTPEENIPAAKIAADDGEAAFLGEILVEGRTEPIVVYFYPDEQTERFVADWPADLDTQGQYTLTVSTRLDHISPEWVPDKESAEPVIFYREDGLINQPWALAGFIGAVVGLIILALMIAIAVSRPTGVVSFIDSRKRALLHEEILGKGWWFQYKSKKDGLKDIGLSKVVVKKIPADKEKAPRAVLVQAFDKQGVLLGEYELHSGETDDLDDGVDVKYD